jgi:hypothetical protein
VHASSLLLFPCSSAHFCQPALIHVQGLVDRSFHLDLAIGSESPIVARVGGLKLTIGGYKRALDQAKGPEEINEHSHCAVDRLSADPVAEVTQVVFTRDDAVQTGQLPIATTLVLLMQVMTEAA